ncbi:hypothetical protein ACWENQ_45050 [Nonomuraea sp. NPDC004354]
MICSEASAPSMSAALDAIGHRVLSPDSSAVEGAERVSVLADNIAKGLEFDHVILLEPAEIAAAKPAGLARLYVALTRAVISLTVLHVATFRSSFADLPAPTVALSTRFGDRGDRPSDERLSAEPRRLGPSHLGHSYAMDT